MTDDLFKTLFAKIDRERSRYEESGLCDAEFIKQTRSNVEKALRKTNGLPGANESQQDLLAPKATEIAKSSNKGNWDSPKPLNDDANFLILEAVRYAKEKKIYLPRERHIDVLEAYYPNVKRASIPPKLGDWQAASLIKWASRKPATIQLDVHGLKKMRDFYPAAQEQKEDIVAAMKILDEDYEFPEIEELLG